MKIEIMNAYTHFENKASNHILQKIGMKFIENYVDKEGANWKWWQMENPNKIDISKNLNELKFRFG